MEETLKNLLRQKDYTKILKLIPSIEDFNEIQSDNTLMELCKILYSSSQSKDVSTTAVKFFLRALKQRRATLKEFLVGIITKYSQKDSSMAEVLLDCILGILTNETEYPLNDLDYLNTLLKISTKVLYSNSTTTPSSDYITKFLYFCIVDLKKEMEGNKPELFYDVILSNCITFIRLNPSLFYFSADGKLLEDFITKYQSQKKYCEFVMVYPFSCFTSALNVSSTTEEEEGEEDGGDLKNVYKKILLILSKLNSSSFTLFEEYLFLLTKFKSVDFIEKFIREDLVEILQKSQNQMNMKSLTVNLCLVLLYLPSSTTSSTDCTDSNGRIRELFFHLSVFHDDYLISQVFQDSLILFYKYSSSSSHGNCFNELIGMLRRLFVVYCKVDAVRLRIEVFYRKLLQVASSSSDTEIASKGLIIDGADDITLIVSFLKYKLSCKDKKNMKVKEYIQMLSFLLSCNSIQSNNNELMKDLVCIRKELRSISRFKYIESIHECTRVLSYVIVNDSVNQLDDSLVESFIEILSDYLTPSQQYIESSFQFVLKLVEICLSKSNTQFTAKYGNRIMTLLKEYCRNLQKNIRNCFYKLMLVSLYELLNDDWKRREVFGDLSVFVNSMKVSGGSTSLDDMLVDKEKIRLSDYKVPQNLIDYDYKINAEKFNVGASTSSDAMILDLNSVELKDDDDDHDYGKENTANSVNGFVTVDKVIDSFDTLLKRVKACREPLNTKEVKKRFDKLRGMLNVE